MKVQKLAGFQRVYQAECFPEEVDKLFGKSSGEKSRYMNWLYTWLELLDRDGLKALNFEQFEHLIGTNKPRLYAIRHPRSKINERYIFVFGAGERSTLSTAFKEKNVKDYKVAIKRAESIYSQMEEYYEY